MTPTELRAWREGRSLSRREAADILGVNERTLERLEYGRSDSSALLPVLERLTDALDRLEAA
jgi:transcriptional regulator with XRE-family HTH domain